MQHCASYTVSVITLAPIIIPQPQNGVFLSSLYGFSMVKLRISISFVPVDFASLVP